MALILPTGVEKARACKVESVQTLIFYQGCQSAEKVEVTYCEGACNTFTRWGSLWPHPDTMETQSASATVPNQDYSCLAFSCFIHTLIHSTVKLSSSAIWDMGQSVWGDIDPVGHSAKRAINRIEIFKTLKYSHKSKGEQLNCPQKVMLAAFSLKDQFDSAAAPCRNSKEMFSREMSSMDHSCTCCRELRTSNRTINLQCMNGDVLPYTYLHVEDCHCKASDCFPMAAVLPLPPE